MNGNSNGNKFNILTVVSVICSVAASTWLIASKVSTSKTDIQTQMREQDTKLRSDFGAAKTNIEGRISALEARPSKETWSDGDMFRWATRLQRDNQNLRGANGIEFRVPEPPMKGDSPNR